MRFPQFTPEHITALKKYADDTALAAQGLADRNKARSEYEDTLKQAQQSAGAYTPLQIPEQRKASSGEALAMVLADLGRELTSTVPASQRQQLPSGLSVYRQLSQEDQDRALRDAQIKHQDALAKLQAKANADKIALEGAAQKYGFTSNEYAQAQENLRFTQSQMTQQAQFNKTFRLQQQEFDEIVKQHGFTNAMDFINTKSNLERNRILNNVAKNPYYYAEQQVASLAPLFGGDMEKARRAAFADVISKVATLDFTEESANRQREIWKMISPSKEAQHTLDGWTHENQLFDKQMRVFESQIASNNRANQPTMKPVPVSQADKFEIARLTKEAESAHTTVRGAWDKWQQVTNNKDSWQKGKNGKLELTPEALKAINEARAIIKEQNQAADKFNQGIRDIYGKYGGQVDVESILNELAGQLGG